MTGLQGTYGAGAVHPDKELPRKSQRVESDSTPFGPYITTLLKSEWKRDAFGKVVVWGPISVESGKSDAGERDLLQKFFLVGSFQR